LEEKLLEKEAEQKKLLSDSKVEEANTQAG